MNQRFMDVLGITNYQKLFKKCENKAPISKEKFTYEEMKNWSGQIGMEIPQDIICIDVDKMEDAILLESIVLAEGINCAINSTPKGKHFFFRRSEIDTQAVNVPNIIGIHVDTRIQGKGYVILPEGSDSKVRSYTVLPGLLDEAPFWVLPDKRIKKFFKENTLRIDEGGRDDLLFRYLMHLKDTTKYAKRELMDVFEIINSHVLLSPMNFEDEIAPKFDRFEEELNPKRELSQAHLDDEAKVPKTVQVGQKVIEKHKLVLHQTQIYKYNGTYYEPIFSNFLGNTILHDFEPHSTAKFRTETIAYIKDYLHEQDKVNTEKLIATPREIVNLKTHECIPNDGEMFVTNGINYKFLSEEEFKEQNPTGKNDFVDNYMDSILTKEQTELLYQMIGYSMLNYLPFRKAFYLVGAANSGKSFLLDRINAIFSKNSTAALDPALMSKDTRMIGSLHNKLINKADDVSSEIMQDDSFFKKCVSGEELQVDVKYGKELLKFTPSATFILTSNYMPSFKNVDEGIFSRLVFIKFNKKIEKIADFKDQWKDEHYEYIIYKSIHAIKQALEHGDFIIDESIQKELDMFRVHESQTLTFIEEIYPKGINRMPARDVYDMYKVWANRNGYQGKEILSNKLFKDELLRNTNYIYKKTTCSDDNINEYAEEDNGGNKLRYILNE